MSLPQLGNTPALRVESTVQMDHCGPTQVWPDLRVHECFELLVDRQPAAPAIISDRILTFAELDGQANALAYALLAQGVTPEEAVGVLAGRCASLPLAFLSILKAGAVYVPMGAELPPQRLANMAAQSGMRHLIALEGLNPPVELLGALTSNAKGAAPAILRPETLDGSALARGIHRPSRLGKPTDLVAILFTSGSTGQPKGVRLQHDACLNMAYGHITAQAITPDDRVLLAAAPGFIMGFRELCLPLLAGAAFVPVSRALIDDPAALLAAMSRHRVTVAMFTPSYLHLFQGAAPTGLRCLLTAGERPIADDARAYARKLDYWNIQGATEVCGTFCMSRVDPNGAGPLPSGRPFSNTGVHLLDEDGREVPKGAVGEIHVVGVGVARGYLNQAQLTADRFIETPYGRAYRTNDLGRWNQDGDLESMGRGNDMVKVSGQAVSLGEIEQSLLRNKAVRYAAAMQHEGKLIAFLESDPPDHAPLEDWRDFLAKTLPGYMLPAQITAIPRMPVNSYGKVDRQALIAVAAAIETAKAGNGADHSALPQGEAERQIAAIWEQILNVSPVLREDNFYALGGTSLQSIAICQRLQALGYAVSPQTIIVAATVAALAGKLVRVPDQNAALEVVDVHQGPAVSGQEDFWIAWKLGLAATGSHVTRVLSVRGMIPALDCWQSAWTQIVVRHLALRTAFFAGEDDRVFWRAVGFEQLTAAAQLSIDHCDSLNAARERITSRSNVPFVPTEPPLARAGLVRVAGGETLFWLTLHHAVVDGLSARVIQEEMHALLSQRALPPAPNGMLQASQAEQQYLASDSAECDRTWWRVKLDTLTNEAGGEAFNELPADRRRPATASGDSAATLVERLDSNVVAALNRLARSQRVGLHALLLTLLAAEARRRDGRSSLIVGSGISVRPPAADRAVGYFVNLLPLILTGGNAVPIAEQIRATQATLSEAVDRRSYPASLLYREFRQRYPHARPHSRTSLFDISLTASPSQTSGDAGVGFTLEPARLSDELASPAAGLDLSFSHEPAGDQGAELELGLVWNPDVFNRSSAQAWLSSFAAWARWLAEDISRADAPLPALLSHEEQCLTRWEQGPTLIRPTKRFHELFEGLADSQPQRPAVITEAGTQSYADLEQQANRVARALLDSGVAHEDPVAVLTDCSAELPATVLGIWKAGAVYVPLALEQPPERLAHMVRDAGASVLIVLDAHAVPPSLARAVKTILRPDDWTRDARFANAPRPMIAGTFQDLAYIIYTSGTTGLPKGVLVQHDSLVNAAYTSGEVFGLTCEDRFSLVATPGFDASLWELGAGLLLGLAIVPISRALRDDPWALKQWYKTYGVTVAFHTPSYLRVSEQTPFEGLRVLIVGGEAPNHDDVKYHAGHSAFWNAYGPTETCIFRFAELISTQPDGERPLPLGRPLANTSISIRRDNGSRVPPGVVGEVWIGGKGLAVGYLNNPELTARQFVETAEGRFYRSGDLGRWTEAGKLELAGRLDHQVKLHGQRVELGEVDQALRSHPAVEQAVTLVEASANGTKSLRSFVRLFAAAAVPAPDEWRGYLSDRLPQYMLPSTVTAVPNMPLTVEGKVDRQALSLIARERGSGAGKSPPQGEMETRIAAVWAELLGGGVSREDNFFALGGNSLLAVTVAHRLSRDLARTVPARELFAAPTLAGFAHRMSELLRSVVPVNEARASVAATSDLATEGQREFWVAEAAGLDTRTFVIPVMRAVEGGRPSLGHWNKAWAGLVARHRALRTYFHEDDDGRLRRAAVPALMATLESATQPDKLSARSFIRQRQAEPFSMAALPLWRAGLVEITESGEQLFWLALHHSVGDGRSIGIITEELGALLGGEKLPPVTCEFGASARREELYLSGKACEEDAGYWRDLLVRQPASAFDEGPLDFPRSLTWKTGNHRLETRLDSSTTQGLKNIARQHAVSLHAVLLTILALEARRRMGRETVIIGTAANTRETAEEAQVVGYYVNMLPVAFHLPPRVEFATALKQTQQSLATGLQHARYPFARMYRDFWNERPQQRHPARYPLFDLAVTENPGAEPAASSLRLSAVSALADGSGENIVYELTDASPGSDMVLIHEDLKDAGLLLNWHVNATLYTRQTATSWLEALRGWAVWLAEDPARARQALPSLLPPESAMLESWEQGATVVRPALRFHQLFERVVDVPQQADRPAVVTATGITTYGALERDANAIAHSLQLNGVVPGSTVGVLAERSANLPAAALGIWKAGATYLPLAADLPAERLAFMARDAGAAFLIALDGVEAPSILTQDLPAPLRPETLGNAFRQAHAHRPPGTGSAGDVAYVIYTSGSTGTPKGTLIGHDAYVNAVLGSGEVLGITNDDRSLMFASPSFDVSLSDIGLPLAFGAALCPIPPEVLTSPSRFRAFLSELHVTVADLTPTYLRLFDGAELPSLRVLVTGGEAPFAPDVETYAGRLQYFNAYGPTESTISSTMGQLGVEQRRVFSCGRPLPNTSVHICDSEGSPVAPGVVGEIWLGGVGLARSYVGRPDLTAAAFVGAGQGRRYRSGDLGRWSASGELEILGRIDDQVKLNGIRIELGEIEHALTGHPGVAQAVALLAGDPEGSHSLWAFVRTAEGTQPPTEESWREYLTPRLPAYMIPSAVIEIASIPISTSGKVDKVALKKLLETRTARGADSPPQDELEAEIARAWSDLLGHRPERIGRDDNFFALGGHSLLAIAVADRLEKTLGYPVPARELFAEPTLRGFARRIRQMGDRTLPDKICSDRATEGQREFWIAEQSGLDTRGFNIALTLAPHGSIPPVVEWRSAWAALVARHDALRTCFREDGDGVLRRFVLPDTGGPELEVSTRSDTPTALAGIRERQTEPFVMEQSPLWRAGLVYVAGDDEPLFWLSLHHSVGDGISIGVLAGELSMLLKGEALPPLAGRFDDSAGREEVFLSGPACREDQQHWGKILSGLRDRSPDGAVDSPLPFEEWPLDFPRPSGRTMRNARGAHVFWVQLDATTVAGLRDFAQKNGASLHGLMLTIMAHEVRRRTGRPEFLLGTAASTRDSSSEARVVGYYVNLLPLVCRVDLQESVEQSLRTMQRSLAEGLQHARYPFARIYSDFRDGNVVAPHPARYPLFDLAVTENPAAQEAKRGDEHELHFGRTASLATSRYELRVNAPAQDMVLIHEGQPDGSIVLHWYVNAALYEKETAEAWIDSLAGWASFLAGGERLPDSHWPALLPQEEALLADWERGPELPLPASNLVARFEHWARVQPQRAALVTEHGTQSYGELNDRSNALARGLLAHGVAQQEPVGVFTGRSTVLPEIVLSVWKAGGCYVPLVCDLPADRLAFIARDAGIRFVVVPDGPELPASLVETGCKVLRLENLSDALLPTHCRPPKINGGGGSELACILYTSGSTGTPKGVMLHHQGLNNLGMGMAAALGIRSNDRVALIASPGFDLWLSDLVMAWASGAAVVPILRGELDDIPLLRAKVARLGISAASMTPSYLHLFDRAEFPGLRVLLTVGEPPQRADALHYAARLHYFNAYGPTENTACASVGLIAAQSQRLTAGRPLANTSIYIRDRQGETVPPGAAGLVWLGGSGLALGYLNHADLTAASFVETSTGRLYNTGDVGRWTQDGELQLLGRSDAQVKLGGQRVELGEIEHRLEAHPSVRQAVAVVETRADNTQILWAFVRLHPQADEPTQPAWHEHLSASLPSYMLPSAVLRVTDFPVNLSGKLDREALLHLAGLRQTHPSEAGALRRSEPHGGMERRIAQAWAEHLQCQGIAREDSFFDLGGSSLRAIAVINQLRRTLHCKVNDLYEHPRLADFASVCRPRPDHLRTLIKSATRHWQGYRQTLATYESEREATLAAARRIYDAHNESYRQQGSGQRRDYGQVMLTGATGYLGSYVLRELLAQSDCQVNVLVRGDDDGAARTRLGGTLRHYFGPEKGAALRDNPRLTVVAGDLRRDDLGLPPKAYQRLAESVQAIFHCAANVKHFGNYWEFHADNVTATGRLLKLAAARASNPADFHFTSTLSVCGKPQEEGFRLFTEYNAAPDAMDENYYVRSKQEAERLVLAARRELANVCIHRVGNLVFAAEGGPLQRNIAENAFFRQLAAFVRLGVVPDDSHLWLCHVDLVARGLVRLAADSSLTNETHHLENARRITLANFTSAAEGVRACAFDAFLERLETVLEDPAMDVALTETLENFGLYRGVSPQAQARRLEIVSERTQMLLGRLGVVWPPFPATGQADLLGQAARLFARQVVPLAAGAAAS